MRIYKLFSFDLPFYQFLCRFNSLFLSTKKIPNYLKIKGDFDYAILSYYILKSEISLKLKLLI
jgi:hypothetical protein